MTFDKKYNPKERENEIRKFWEKEGIYKFNKDSNKPIFSIDTPPPTISGRMHIGHAYSYSQQDFVARFQRMNGKEVYFPFGTDDNGLPTEKLVQKAKGVNLRKIDRKEAIKIVLEYLEEERPKFIQDWKDLGMSCDFDLRYSTIDKFSQKISQQSFLDLVEKGLIERRKGPIPWDRVFQTTIAQAELEDKEMKSKMNYIKAKILGTENTYIIYATTRPEMIFGCHGFSLEDEGDYVKLKVGDEYWIFGAETYEEKLNKFGIEFELVEKLKGNNLIGEKVIIPLINREIEISHDKSIKADLGTGSAYFCSFGGLEDIEYIKRHPDAKIYEIMNKDGTLNELCGEFKGLIASEEGRYAVMRKLKELGVLIAQENITQIVNVGERSGVPVEYIASNQWFVKYLDKKEYFWEMANKFNWTPEFMKSRIENWIKGLNWDWGFSRQRHFGIPIPVWYCKNCEKQYFAKSEQLPVDPTQDKPSVEKCENCGGTEFIGERDVFDTWFTSASSPIIASKLLGDNVFNKVFPMTLRPQGHDIINFWLFYTMAKTNLLYGINPFRDVNISGWVLASDGTKMSKSKGNTIAPQDVVSKYSNDAIRFAASATKLGADQPFQEKEVKTGFAIANKIYNANKFASMLLENFKKEDKEINKEDYNNLNSIDKWILAKLQNTIKKATEYNNKYDYSNAKSEFEIFFMRDIADNYIEIVKQRLWKPEEFGKDETLKAQKTIYNVLFNAMKGLAPILPFITEEVYQNFYKNYEEEKSIHLTSWPQIIEYFRDEEIIKLGDKYVSIVSAVRKFKSEKQVSMKTELEYLNIQCDNKLKEFIENSILDLKAVTGAKEINFIDNANIETGFDDVKVEIEIVK